MEEHHTEKPDVFRFPRLEKEEDRASMIEVWNEEMNSEFPTRRQVRIQIGKRLYLIKGVKKHGKFRRWFDEQGYEFGFRSAEKYMQEALEHYQKNNTNNSSYSPEPKTDEVHEVTAEKEAEFNSAYTYAFILFDLTPEEIQRLKLLRKSEERVNAHAAVIQALQPWLRGERVAQRPA